MEFTFLVWMRWGLWQFADRILRQERREAFVLSCSGLLSAIWRMVTGKLPVCHTCILQENNLNLRKSFFAASYILCVGCWDDISLHSTANSSLVWTLHYCQLFALLLIWQKLYSCLSREGKLVVLIFGKNYRQLVLPSASLHVVYTACKKRYKTTEIVNAAIW